MSAQLRRRSASEMLEHRIKQRQSGLKISDYCKREGICSSNWYFWAKRLDQKAAGLPVHQQSSPISFLQLPPQQKPEPRIDVTLPNGAHIIMPVACDSTYLRQIVRIVSALRPR